MPTEANNLSTISSLADLKKFADLNWTCQIGKRGGRFYSNGTEKFKLNSAIKKLDQLASANSSEALAIEQIASKFRKLSKEKVAYNNIFLNISTKARQFFGNLGYNREKILNHWQFQDQKVVTSEGNYRYLVLEGDTGKVACRVYGECAKTIPRISKEGTIECATRSLARMKNLIAVRGDKEGARMIGPCDYYGNVEKPHKYAFTINIENGIPIFLKQAKSAAVGHVGKGLVDFTGKTMKVEATWHRGASENIQEIKKKYENDQQKAFGASLFPNSGILEINQDKVELPAFDPTQVDLSPFKARLVKNDAPFQIVTEKVSAKDEFRPVTYFFEDNYAREQVDNGGGLFLETHDFTQTMTPIDEKAGGFITLGRWDKENKQVLELIGVQIPFGYTLIIEKGCIHGDTTFKGMYMMSMTSNHVTMNSADTVFLKDKNTSKNFDMTMQSSSTQNANSENTVAPPPVAYFEKNDKMRFKKELNSDWKIYNPFKRIFNPFGKIKKS